MPKKTKRKARGTHFYPKKRRNQSYCGKGGKNAQNDDPTTTKPSLASRSQAEEAETALEPNIIRDQLKDVIPNISTVSDTIVIDNINDKSNSEKPWFSLKDPIFDYACYPASPTSIIIVPSTSSPLRKHSPVQDSSHPDSSHSPRSALVSFDEHLINESTLSPSGFSPPLRSFPPPSPPLTRSRSS